jgi:hypothetical protein
MQLLKLKTTPLCNNMTGVLEAEERELAAAIVAAPKAQGTELFEQLAQGQGIDVIDFRFQGRLSKINADQIHYSVPKPNSVGDVFSTPIHHSFATKRIEPHKDFRLWIADSGELFVRNLRLPIDEKEKLKSIVAEIRSEHKEKEAWVAAMYKQRGFTFQSIHGPVYVSNKNIERLFLSSKEINGVAAKPRKARKTPSSAATATSGAFRVSDGRGEGSVSASTDALRKHNVEEGVLSAQQGETQSKESS